MSKKDILIAFRTDFEDPRSEKSGEYLETLILRHAKDLLDRDRQGLLAVLVDWIEECGEPRTMLAVSVVRELRLQELRGRLLALRAKIASGQAFMPFYLRKLDGAIEEISGN